MPVKSPLMKSVPAVEAEKHPALVIVWVVVEDNVATFCHFAVAPVPVLVIVPVARVAGSLDGTNKSVSAFADVPAPVPQPTKAPVKVL